MKLPDLRSGAYVQLLDEVVRNGSVTAVSGAAVHPNGEPFVHTVINPAPPSLPPSPPPLSPGEDWAHVIQADLHVDAGIAVCALTTAVASLLDVPTYALFARLLDAGDPPPVYTLTRWNAERLVGAPLPVLDGLRAHHSWFSWESCLCSSCSATCMSYHVVTCHVAAALSTASIWFCHPLSPFVRVTRVTMSP